MYTRQQIQRKTRTQSSASPKESDLFRQRPFNNEASPTTAQPQNQEAPNLQTQLERATRFGHNFGRLQVDNSTPAIVQPKLAIGAPGDKYEQEADQMASQVMSMNAPASQQSIQRQGTEPEEEEVQMKPLASMITPLVQRQEAAPEEEELQTKPLVQRQEAAPEEEELQAKPLVQRQEAAPEEEELQTKPLVQRQEAAPEEEELQTKPLVQRQEAAPEEEELQAKPLVQRQEAAPEEEELQTKPLVQRQEAPQEEELQAKPLVQRQEAPQEKELQAKPSPQESEASHNDASENLENQLNSSKGGGSPLPDNVRSFMEPRFGADFSQVRVHTDTQAVQMNQAVGAQAFTHGSDIYFGAGKSPAVSDLTAHELTHVVQQTGGVQRQIQPMRRSGRGNESNPYSTENVNRPRRGNRAGTRSHDQEGIELQTNPKIKPTVDDEGHALWDGSRDRMRWTENTYQDVLDEKGNPKQRTTGETEYQCAITKEYFLRGGEAKKRNEESIQIDHKTDWRTFVMNQVDSVRFSYKGHLWEAYKLSKVLEAYNNKANLEPICQSKNGSKSGPKHYDGDMITYAGKVPEQTVTSDSE